MQKTNTKAVSISLKRILSIENQPIIKGNTVKAHVNEVDILQITELVELYESRDIKDVLIKRSGTGVTIIVEV